MFDTSANNLRDEIQEGAIPLRDSHLDLTFELKQRYAGPRFRSDWLLPDMHENIGFEWTTNMVPNLIFSSPKVSVSHDAAPDTDQQVQAMQWGLNGWIPAANVRSPLEEIATDLQFEWGVGMVVMERCADVPGEFVFGDELAHDARDPIPTLRPMIYRLPPSRFFMDSQGTHWTNARYLGHEFIEDKDDMLAAVNADGSPKYDKAAIEACPIDDGLEELRAKTGTAQGITHKSRKQILGYEVFVPETGMIYCLSRAPISVRRGEGGPEDAGPDTGKGGAYLRPPRKYVGPATGPYVLFGAYLVPDQLYPLSPLMASAMIEDEINAHAGQASEDAGSAKQLVVASGTKAAKVLNDGKNGDVVVIQGLSGKVQVVRIGGANPENLNYIELLRQRKDRLIGLTQAVSGNVTGATAEEVHTAQANRNLRVKYQQSRFREGVVRLLYIAASQMWHRPECRFWCKIVDPVSGEESRGLFQGGQVPGEPGSEGLVFDGLRIEIEPYTMEAVDEALLRHNMQEFGAIVRDVAVEAPQTPWLDWRRYLRDQGEMFNIRDGDKYLNWEMVKRAQMLTNPILFGIVPPGMDPAAGGGPPQSGAAPAPSAPQARPASSPRRSQPTTNSRAAGGARRSATAGAR